MKLARFLLMKRDLNAVQNTTPEPEVRCTLHTEIIMHNRIIA